MDAPEQRAMGSSGRLDKKTLIKSDQRHLRTK